MRKTTAPKYRKQLNEDQINLLAFLHKFRFGSQALLAYCAGKKDVYRQLCILEDQHLIAKRYDSTYRLHWKPAAYYLLPAGARQLELARNKEVDVKLHYKARTVSEQFIRHCLDVFTARNHLYTLGGDNLLFFTKHQLHSYEYFPEKLPDAYIRYRREGEDKQFFLEICHDKQPFFTVIRRLRYYITYAEEGEWAITDTDLPTILLVCDSPRLQKRISKAITALLENSWEDEITFGLTTKEQLDSDDECIWQLITGDDTETDTSLYSLELQP